MFKENLHTLSPNNGTEVNKKASGFGPSHILRDVQPEAILTCNCRYTFIIYAKYIVVSVNESRLWVLTPWIFGRRGPLKPVFTVFYFGGSPLRDAGYRSSRAGSERIIAKTSSKKSRPSSCTQGLEYLYRKR